MDWYNAVVALGGFAGAIVTIIKLVAPIKKKVDSLLSTVQQTADDVKDIKEDNFEQYLSILRLTVMNSEIPIPERLIAGKKYVDKGGNGKVKAYYETLIREHTI